MSAVKKSLVSCLPGVARTRMRDVDLRAYSRRLMHGLDIPLPFTVVALCERLGAERGTPIVLLEWELAVDGPSGMLVSRDHEDVIIYQKNTSQAHQAHIVLHEVGHIVAADFAGTQVGDAGFRTCDSPREERDAEIIASTVMHRVQSMSRRVDRLDQFGQHSVQGSLALWSTWT